MGCGVSSDNKEKKGGGGSDEINTEMKDTKVPEFDEFFSAAAEVLSTLEDLRSAFQDTRDEMNEIGRTQELVEPSFIEALRVFFWSVSAHKEGNIQAAGLRFETDPPSLTVNCEEMNFNTNDFSEALKSLIEGVISAPGQLAELPGKIQEFQDKALELSKDIPGKVKGAGLGVLDTAKAIGNAGTNFKTISSGFAKAPKVFEVTNQAVKDIKETLSKVKELIGNADEIGKKAHEKKIYKIDEIFDHFQTAPKKTPEQVKDMKKGKNKKKFKKYRKKGDHGKDGKKDGHQKEKDHKDKKEHKEGH